jgi:hypothetical protein
MGSRVPEVEIYRFLIILDPPMAPTIKSIISDIFSIKFWPFFNQFITHFLSIDFGIILDPIFQHLWDSTFRVFWASFFNDERRSCGAVFLFLLSCLWLLLLVVCMLDKSPKQSNIKQSNIGELLFAFYLFIFCLCTFFKPFGINNYEIHFSFFTF